MTDDSTDALTQRLARLPRESAPGAQVWQHIQEKIEEKIEEKEKIAAHPAHEGSAEQPDDVLSSHQTSGLREFAAAAVFAAATVVIILWGMPQESDALKAPAGFAQVESFEVEGMDSAQLMLVRNNLHSSLQLALDELSPQTRDTVIENLARIDMARAEIDSALKSDPANQLLKQMLLASYTNEITLLNEFTLMARSAPQRTQL